jgi:hypothetical protein
VFSSKVEAAAARDVATRQLHGAAGAYNFPESGERCAL